MASKEQIEAVARAMRPAWFSEDAEGKYPEQVEQNRRMWRGYAEKAIDAANASLLEIIQDASDFLKSIEGAGYGGISRYDVLCVRLEEALKGNTGNAPLLDAVRVAYEMACSILPIVEGSQGGDGEEVYDYADEICTALRPFLESEGK